MAIPYRAAPTSSEPSPPPPPVSEQAKENTPPTEAPVKAKVLHKITGPFKYTPSLLAPLPEPLTLTPLTKEEENLLAAPLPAVPQLRSRWVLQPLPPLHCYSLSPPLHCYSQCCVNMYIVTLAIMAERSKVRNVHSLELVDG